MKLLFALFLLIVITSCAEKLLEKDESAKSAKSSAASSRISNSQSSSEKMLKDMDSELR